MTVYNICICIYAIIHITYEVLSIRLRGSFYPLLFLVTALFHAFITSQSPSVFHLCVIGLSPTIGSSYFFQCIKGESWLHILLSNVLSLTLSFCLAPLLIARWKEEGREEGRKKGRQEEEERKEEERKEEKQGNWWVHIKTGNTSMHLYCLLLSSLQIQMGCDNEYLVKKLA